MPAVSSCKSPCRPFLNHPPAGFNLGIHVCGVASDAGCADERCGARPVGLGILAGWQRRQIEEGVCLPAPAAAKGCTCRAAARAPCARMTVESILERSGCRRNRRKPENKARRRGQKVQMGMWLQPSDANGQPAEAMSPGSAPGSRRSHTGSERCRQGGPELRLESAQETRGAPVNGRLRQSAGTHAGSRGSQQVLEEWRKNYNSEET
jgi:hypothetical protein